MKKIIALIIAGLMVLSFAACGGNTEETTAEETTQAAELTVAGTFAAAFKEEAAKEGATTNSVATALSQNPIVPFGPTVTDMEEGALAGFYKEITGFEACTAFAPMIGTIPFVSYVFQLAEGADIEAFTATLKENANLNWNVCTSAEEMLVETEGNMVFFIMAVRSFDQEPAEGDVAEGDEVVEGGDVGNMEVLPDGPAAFDPEAETAEDTTVEAVEETTVEETTVA